MNYVYIKPYKTTKRPKEQIVSEAEHTYLKNHLVTGDEPHCINCFHKRLDALVECYKETN